MDKIKSILRFAMRMEKDAADFYGFYSDKAAAQETKDIFAELAEIEKQHFRILQKKYEELQFTEPPLTISWVVDDSFKAQDPHILADNSDSLPAAEGASNDVLIIRTAYLIEHDFEYFYRKAVESVEEPGVKKFLEELAGWEKQHSELFHRRYQALLEKSWQDIANLIL